MLVAAADWSVYKIPISIVSAGGGEELDWSQTMMFDAMGALSTKYNDTPDKASRTYDADRDGFVISAN